jgi:hypothetical protein
MEQRYKTAQCYRTVHGSIWYIKKKIQLQKVHVTKWYSVTKPHVTEQYIIITVQYHIR